MMDAFIDRDSSTPEGVLLDLARNDAWAQDGLEAAALLLDAGLKDEALLVYRMAALRQGFSPSAVRRRRAFEHEAGLSGPVEPPAQVQAAPTRRGDLVVQDLDAVLRASPGSTPLPEPPSAVLSGLRSFGAARPPAGARGAPADVAALVASLCEALQPPPEPTACDELERVLETLHRDVLSFGPFDLDDPLASVGELAVHAAFNGLRHFLLDTYELAYAPFGGPQVLHAFSHAHEFGIGAYGARLAEIIESGHELCALIRVVAEVRPELREIETDRWVLLLVGRLRGPLLHRVLDDLADVGRLRVVWGVLAGTLQRRGERPDRVMLERVRDAGLDLGDLDLALAAQRLDAHWWGEDRNEWLALGDIHAYRGAYAEAQDAFATALRLDPQNGHARRCLEALRDGRRDIFVNRGGFGTPEPRRIARADHLRGAGGVLRDQLEQTVALDVGGLGEGLAFELAPKVPAPPHLHDGLHIRRLGARRARSRWGVLPALRGVEAVRGVYVCDASIAQVRITLGGYRLGRCAPARAALGAHDRRAKYVFNLWVDVTPFPEGRYEVELAFETAGGETRSHREWVLVEAPAHSDRYSASDGFVAPGDGPADALEQRINALPSQVREARRQLFSSPPETILVLRADQLGDLVCSIPALRRLRELFPEAWITGLLSPANAELGATLPMLDEVLVADFPFDVAQGRRVMALGGQVELRDLLGRRAFDLAIDLADNSPSRLLTPLSGAPYLVGMRAGDYPFLDLGFDATARDPVDGSENIPATNKALALVEWLGVAMKSYGETLRREDLSPSLLERFGLRPGGYAVLHTGARLRFSRWPHYADLAALLLARTSLDLVVVSDDPAFGLSLDPGLRADPRLRLIEERLPFDTFDALLSYCAVFVGNDSGPKHLASLRGVEVVSLHCARNNWNEWGQENTGLILSRRVPCAGCQISDAPEECGKDIACLSLIRPEEVFAAVRSRLP